MPRAFLKSSFFKSRSHVINNIKYIAKQSPLFTGSGELSTEKALAMVDDYSKSIKWKHIFSLQGEDAERLAIDRGYMKNLVETQKSKWAIANNISPENLVVMASWHEVSAHPHIHMIMFSKNSREGYIVQREDKTQGEAFEKARETIKSSISNEIFKNDLHDIKVSKATQRTVLNKEMQNALERLAKSSHSVDKKIVSQMNVLAQALSATKGKHQYGYLAPELKKQVNNILQNIVRRDAEVNKIYSSYRISQSQLTETYVDSDITKAEKMKKWEKAFFSPPKGDDTSRHNIIISTADKLNNIKSNERYREKLCYNEGIDEGNIYTINSQENIEISVDETGVEEAPVKSQFYKGKNPETILQNMLYTLGVTMRDDAKRKQNAHYYNKPHKKMAVKKIQKVITQEKQSIQP